ncbi:MAG: GNAT family N-acetyltransferase [Negativicutes bacterium]|nr:GNAT family N-acetyltransferase [Negativicutes bacterium]
MQIARLIPTDLRLEPLLGEIAASLEHTVYNKTATLRNLRDLIQSYQGLVVSDSSKIYAFLIYHLKGSVCFLDFAFAGTDRTHKAMLNHLIAALIRLSREDPEIDTIRCDFIPWFADALPEALLANHFLLSPRLLMRADAPFRFPVEAHPDRSMLAWQPEYHQPAAQLLAQIFSGSEESLWDSSIRNVAGCRQFLSETYSGRFGIFDPGISTLLRYQDQPAGLALCTWGEEGDGFIAAFGVLPQFAGLGLGGSLLRHVLHKFDTMQAPAVELAVSQTNAAAIRLYTSHQFEIKDKASLYYFSILRD